MFAFFFFFFFKQPKSRAPPEISGTPQVGTPGARLRELLIKAKGTVSVAWSGEVVKARWARGSLR